MTPPKRPYLTFHVLWAVFGFAVLLAALVLGKVLYARHDATKIREQERLLAASQILHATFERNLASINLSLASLIKELNSNTRGHDLNEHLKIIDDAMPMVDGLNVFDASGHITASSVPDLRGLERNFSDRAYFKTPKNHPSAETLYVSPPFQTVRGSYTIALTRMLTGPQGQFAGVVMALLEPRYFDSMMASMLYAPNVVAAIYHGDGTAFLVAPDARGDLTGKSLRTSEPMVTRHKESGQAANVVSGMLKLTGDDRMLAIRDVQPAELRMNYPLEVAISRLQTDIYARWRDDAIEMVGSALAVSLAAAWALYFYQRRYRHYLAGETIAARRQQLAASVFTHAREGITITDPTGNIIDVNDMFTRITGYSREEVLGKNPRILQSGRQDKAFYAAMWHALTTQGHWSGEVWNRRKNGEVYAEIMTVSAVRDDQGDTLHYVALFSDITATKAHQHELERIAHYDTLTGLPNRLLLGDRLHQAIAQSQRRDQALAVVYLDLDNIKAINDDHGHQAGDAVLIAVGKAMQAALRDGDTLARIGGDEFVAVLVDLDQTRDCIPVIERLLEAAATAVNLPASPEVDGAEPDQSVQVSASIGVTFYPQDDVDADVLLRHADQAMYLAKQAGRNRYHLFDIAQDVAIQTRHEELKRISEALDQGEFVLYYQPKVNMRTGEVIGAEALIRWQHPERGLLPPGVFLPVIEDHPISVALGEWVIDTALGQMSTWHALGLDLPVSVNIDALQLQQKNFPERLRDILAAHPDVAPHCLRLEILETSALQDIPKVSDTMRACQALGVTFALDDFGTGYSSLTYLRHLPAEMIKIDQTFVRNMTDSPDDLAIVKGVIGLSEVFHRQVIAEGVETKALGDLLLGIGCDLAQGYGVARPMPAQEMPEWTARWRADSVWTA